MAVTIHVERSGTDRFHVTVQESNSQTEHVVSLKANYYEKLTRKQISEELLIERSFRFLLKREPKESILREFNLPVTGHYFPDYEREIQNQLAS